MKGNLLKRNVMLLEVSSGFTDILWIFMNPVLVFNQERKEVEEHGEDQWSCERLQGDGS